MAGTKIEVGKPWDSMDSYGRAAKFVRRALDTMANMRAFYRPTPSQACFRMLDYIQRVQAIGVKYLPVEARDRALRVLYATLLEAQGMDAADTVADHPMEVSAGDAAGAQRLGRVLGSSVSQRAAASDFMASEPAARQLRQEEDVPVEFRDPMEVLSRYRMGRARRWPVVMPHEEPRFALNGQHHMMTWLRREEARLGMNRIDGR